MPLDRSDGWLNAGEIRASTNKDCDKVALLLVIRQFGRALRHAWLDPAFQFLKLLAGGLLALGGRLYFCVITLATVGYGDFSPKTDLGKILVMLYIFIGIGLLIAVFTRLADALLAAQRDQAAQHERRE